MVFRKIYQEIYGPGLPWWSSDWESTLHAGSRATTAEPLVPNKRAAPAPQLQRSSGSRQTQHSRKSKHA